ncbi:MAG: hypothetical protein OEM62_10040 [Acidobacteriota bacterium]|nr:hypothetical protein [Acidobacteriota bacterium]
MSPSALLRFEIVRPEPARLWIRHAPRSWPGPDGWWIDLARGAAAGPRLKTATLPFPQRLLFHDVVYLPPVASGAELLRQRVLEHCARLGVPALQQVLPDASAAAAGGSLVVDLTEKLLRGGLRDISLPHDAWVVWPLISGLTDGASTRERGLDVLAAKTIAGVLPIAPALTPRERRQLAEFAPATAYSRLFHPHSSPRLEEFWRSAAQRNLARYPRRPPLGDSWRAPNRRLAEHFAILADLWLRCGRPEGRGQLFFRTARRLDEEPLDVAELSRRGGLQSVEWLDDECREETRRLADGEPSVLLAEMEALTDCGGGS